MLAQDYTRRLEEVIHQVPWDIELPAEWHDFFIERGEVPSFANDDRGNQRLKVRIHGVMWIESTLHFCKRSATPSGIYTRDFSRQGVGLLCAFQLYPEEVIRLALPTFWVQMKVVRTRRLTSKCFEIGTLLVSRHDPSMGAFDVSGLLQKAS